MATWDLRRLQQALDKRSPAPVYLIFGEETYLVNEAVKLVRDKVLSEGAADFNYDQFFADEADLSQVADTVEMLPMMAERRLVVLKNTESLKDKDWDSLFHLLENPLDTACLVMVAEKVDKRKKFFKKTSDNGIVVELRRPFENQLPAWIDYIGHNHDLKFSPDARTMILQLVGQNLSEINNETMKLKQYLGDKTEATIDDVLKVVSHARVDSIFDLTNAIGRRDRSGALVYLAHLLENGQSEVGALSLILRHVRILAALREGQSIGLTGAKLSAKVGIPNFFLKQYQEQAKKWDDRKITKTLNALHKTDLALKSSPVSSHIWLENFIVQTCQ